MGPRPTTYRHRAVQFRLVYDAESQTFLPEIISSEDVHPQDAPVQVPCAPAVPAS